MKYLVFLLCIIQINALAQIQLPKDTLFYYQKGNYKYSKIYGIDSLFIEIYTRNVYSGKDSFIHINGSHVDSTSLYLTNPFKIDDKIFFNHKLKKDSSYFYYFYDLKKMKFIPKKQSLITTNEEIYIDYSYTGLYTKEEDDKFILSILSSENFEVIKEIDLTKYGRWFKDKNGNKVGPNAEITEVIFLEDNSFLICFGVSIESAYYETYKTFLVKKDEIIDLSNKYDVSWSQFYFLSPDRKYIKVREKSNYIIRDLNYNKVGNGLTMGRQRTKSIISPFAPMHRGVLIFNHAIQSYFITSKVASGASVLVPYKFIPQLDLTMYKAHKNNKLTEEDIEGLDLYALGILRNSIFAKYNYAFNSEFYQAYFNLFAFYNHYEKKGKRTKNVNDKLTDTDKANVAFVLKAEKKLKE